MSSLRDPDPNWTNSGSSLFARGELARLALDIMRGTGEPLPISAVAAGILAAKGIALPGPHTMRLTRRRLQQMFSTWGKRGAGRARGQREADNAGIGGRLNMNSSR